MTRPTQKDAERRTLRGVLAALDLRPDEVPKEGEAPDFTMRVAGRVIGVEITTYRSGAAVDDGSQRRPVENEWEWLKAASDAFRDQDVDLRDISIGLMFKAAVPPRRQHGAFLDEIAAFVRSYAAELTPESRAYWPPAFATPLMQNYLRTLYLRKDPYAEWYTSLAGGFVARPGPTIAEIVAEKSTTRFRPTDEVWLAIQCGARISEMMLDLMGVEDFDAVPSLDPYAFSRVLVLTYSGVYEWHRGAGWQRLTGGAVPAKGMVEPSY